MKVARALLAVVLGLVLTPLSFVPIGAIAGFICGGFRVAMDWTVKLLGVP